MVYVLTRDRIPGVTAFSTSPAIAAMPSNTSRSFHDAEPPEAPAPCFAASSSAPAPGSKNQEMHRHHADTRPGIAAANADINVRAPACSPCRSPSRSSTTRVRM